MRSVLDLYFPVISEDLNTLMFKCMKFCLSFIRLVCTWKEAGVPP